MAKEIRRFPRLPDKQDEILIKVVEKLSKRYKGDENRSVALLRDSIFAEPELWVPTGIFPIDCIVSSGRGIPDGIVEIYGPPGAGKSAVLEHILANSQNLGYFTSLFPMEYSFNLKRAVRVGIDPHKLVIHDAETIEDVYDETKDFVRGIRKHDPVTPIVIGWDTIAATPTRTELEHKKGLDASDMGKMAAQMSKFFRRLVRFLRKNHVCLVCINQTRTNLGKMWGDKETTYGGVALQFYAWVRLRVRVDHILKGHHDHEVGIMSTIKIRKNKVDAPFRECNIPIYWTYGIDRYEAMWEYGKEQDVFKINGRHYKWHGETISRDRFRKMYKGNKHLIRQELRAASRRGLEGKR